MPSQNHVTVNITLAIDQQTKAAIAKLKEAITSLAEAIEPFTADAAADQAGKASESNQGITPMPDPYRSEENPDA